MSEGPDFEFDVADQGLPEIVVQARDKLFFEESFKVDGTLPIEQVTQLLVDALKSKSII